MKKFALILFAAILVCAGCQTQPTEKTDTPGKLLQVIRDLAQKQDYNSMKAYIYPLHADGRDMRKGIIEGIKNKLEFNDFAYSDEAIAAIIAKHLDKFKPMPDEMVKGMLLSEQGVNDAKLRKIAQADPKAFLLFQYGEDAHIMLVKIDGNYKLLFWEDITAVTRKK